MRGSNALKTKIMIKSVRSKLLHNDLRLTIEMLVLIIKNTGMACIAIPTHAKVLIIGKI
ncbi:MAG: hypothetical protein JWR02_2558 [Mucilaginibacter sp.]|nr:hypothetical protein [Mucilaginibacter sp.]